LASATGAVLGQIPGLETVAHAAEFKVEGDIFDDKRVYDPIILNRTMTMEEYTKAVTDLNPFQRYITMESGTEKPFSGQKYVNEWPWDVKDDGVYTSAVSGEILFSSKNKYDSGFGWPSFSEIVDKSKIVTRWDPRDRANTQKPKEKWRVEVLDKASASHLGYVYSGGPGKSQLRYIVNAGALKFVPGNPDDYIG